MKLKTVFGALILSLSTSAAAVDPTYFNPYRSAKPIQHDPEKTGLTCAQLDREISRITPYTYNYRPDFDKDPYVGASIIAGASYSLVGYGYLAFRFAGDFMEDKRIQTAEGRIEHLRRLKAEKFCYEDRG
jgi:hypothetical protein